jgi:hypothetical protein
MMQALKSSGNNWDRKIRMIAIATKYGSDGAPTKRESQMRKTLLLGKMSVSERERERERENIKKN